MGNAPSPTFPYIRETTKCGHRILPAEKQTHRRTISGPRDCQIRPLSRTLRETGFRLSCPYPNAPLPNLSHSCKTVIIPTAEGKKQIVFAFKLTHRKRAAAPKRSRPFSIVYFVYAFSKEAATPMPPPMQRVARPFLASGRRIISWARVTMIRAPEQPTG